MNRSVEFNTLTDDGVLIITSDDEYVWGPSGSDECIEGRMDLDGSFTFYDLKELVRMWKEHGHLKCRNQ